MSTAESNITLNSNSRVNFLNPDYFVTTDDPNDWIDDEMLQEPDTEDHPGELTAPKAEQASENRSHANFVNADTSNIAARFAGFVATPGDRDAAILACITAVGAHLGPSSSLIYNGRRIYPTLYSAIVGQASTVGDWYRWFNNLPKPPSVIRSGIFKAESLVYLVRDSVLRPDKVFTGKGENPQWRTTKVDAGVADKRHLIMQAMGPLLTSKTSATAKRLLDTLNVAYDEGEVKAYVGYRDGGFHGTKAAHIALLIPEPNEKIAAAIWELMPGLLLARAEGPAIDLDSGSDIWDLLPDIQLAIQKAPPEVTIDPSAKCILDSEGRSQRPYAVRTLLRLAHILAVLESSPIVTEGLLIQARAVVEASDLTHRLLCDRNRTSLTDEILKFVEATKGGVCSKDEIGDHFRPRHGQAKVNLALAQLKFAHQLLHVLVKTEGRPREEWRIPKGL
jgi:hypothetical protein